MILSQSRRHRRNSIESKIPCPVTACDDQTTTETFTDDNEISIVEIRAIGIVDPALFLERPMAKTGPKRATLSRLLRASSCRSLLASNHKVENESSPRRSRFTQPIQPPADVTKSDSYGFGALCSIAKQDLQTIQVSDSKSKMQSSSKVAKPKSSPHKIIPEEVPDPNLSRRSQFKAFKKMFNGSRSLSTGHAQSPSEKDGFVPAQNTATPREFSCSGDLFDELLVEYERIVDGDQN
mmetsp:Transcript_20641/g.26625  ORF Transcript_20641/g.26625 Transcript_20641/m.26625 type:complete len:237 (-) Transcript_20641:140-850(-)|eukprot:CAMPEP_0198142410 /NCGR_PEP_ID=MMETSP1443-20131203/5199_1 /TAXON_ID=186043 /ORGANISM="Entomoneis sp., Strain CCMP2396" /LENGTH=236 /DNA_ID=CAMNT_0043805407 /DNA_START=100 /DNA_END=810 /DNA_ORIENTATION=-